MKPRHCAGFFYGCECLKLAEGRRLSRYSERLLWGKLTLKFV